MAFPGAFPPWPGSGPKTNTFPRSADLRHRCRGYVRKSRKHETEGNFICWKNDRCLWKQRRTGEEASVWGCVPPAAAEGWPFVLRVDVVRGRPSLAVDGAEGTGRGRSGDTADGGSSRAPAPVSVCQRGWEDQTRVSAKPCSACWVAFGHHRGAPGWLEMCLQSLWGGGLQLMSPGRSEGVQPPLQAQSVSVDVFTRGQLGSHAGR